MRKHAVVFTQFSILNRVGRVIAFFLAGFLIFGATGFAQTVKVSGTVRDAMGELIGVTVLEKGTTNGIVTDLSGKYTLQTSANAVLQFSYIGYVTQEIPVGNKTTIDVLMKEDTKSLDEVVVIGYGTLEKRSVTTSVTSINSKNMIAGLGGATIANAMRGKVSGLTVTGSSSPNSSNDMQLRGVASINAGKGPLVVIDGIPGGDMRSVNQEDIESIDILKDGSAAAIYGTRAAGGVILITTKKAKSGTMQITYTGELSTETIRKKPEVLSPEEFVKNGLGEDLGYKTDWYDEITRPGELSQKHVVNMSGGSENALIYTTFSYQDQTGISIGDARKDYSGRVNTNLKFFDNFLEISTHSQYRTAERDQRVGDGIYNMALKLNPTQTPYDATQSHGYNVWTGGWEYYNPVADIMLRQKGGIDKWLLTDISAKLNITKEFTTTATVGYQWKEWQATEFTSSQHKASKDNSRAGEAYHGFSKDYDKLFEWIFNYNKRFGEHDIKAVAGYSFQEYNGESFSLKNWDFPVDGVGPWDIGKGKYLSEGKAEMSSYKDVRTRLISFFGRVNYSFQDKYILSASLRREGSSKFGDENKWGMFPAVSAAWRISDEAFMESLDMIDDLKLRVGYGVTGNNDFDSGKSTRMYASDTWWLSNGTWRYTYGSKHNVNNALKWEEKKEINFGLDYSLFNNRVYGKVDIYQRKVDGMIYDISVSVPPAVHDKTTMNVGTMKTNGWDFEISAVPVQTSDWNYTTTFRFSHFATQIESLWGSTTYWNRMGFPAPGSPGDANRLEAGSTIGQFWLWKFAGFSDEGTWLLYDKDGNVFDSSKQTKKIEDKALVGQAIPDLMVSWENTVSWKNFDLSVYLRSWIGHDVFNSIEMYYGLPTVKEQNVLASAYEKHKNVKAEKELCDYWLQDGTFLKIDAINLGYTLNLGKYNKFVKNMRTYLTLRDVACFTSYEGMDPEANLNGLDPGFEMFNSARATYPKTIYYTLGLQLTF